MDQCTLAHPACIHVYAVGSRRLLVGMGMGMGMNSFEHIIVHCKYHIHMC